MQWRNYYLFSLKESKETIGDRKWHPQKLLVILLIAHLDSYHISYLKSYHLFEKFLMIHILKSKKQEFRLLQISQLLFKILKFQILLLNLSELFQIQQIIWTQLLIFCLTLTLFMQLTHHHYLYSFQSSKTGLDLKIKNLRRSQLEL